MLKHALVTVVAITLGIGAARAEDATALLHQYRCYICHTDKEPGAGPAYVDVATTYRGTPNAAAKLAAIIKKGAHSGGPWHMPPHPEVSQADALTMARYILAVRN